MTEQGLEHGKIIQEKDGEIAALTARAVHFENVWHLGYNTFAAPGRLCIGLLL